MTPRITRDFLVGEARFIDGLVTPLLYRRAGEAFDGGEKQAVTQWQGSAASLRTGPV